MKDIFDFNIGIKKNLLYLFLGGLLLCLIGVYQLINSGHGHEESTEIVNNYISEDGHSEFQWYKRVYSNLWINIVYFLGISISAIFFVAIQYVSQAGWSAGILRVPLAIGRWLLPGSVLMLIVFAITNHDIFHWTHEYLYDKSDPRYDYVIDGKKAYLNLPFFLGRMVFFLGIWYLFYSLILKHVAKEDKLGGTESWEKLFTISTVFVVFYAFTQSVAAWDWVLSIDTHWFSTLFGWYVFASMVVSGVTVIALITIYLQTKGLMKYVNDSHLHDLAKFMFGFSVFWAYLWFSQFMLIWYANIPEEVTYFVTRIEMYPIPFFTMFCLNFIFPFLVLMNSDYKRVPIFIIMAGVIILIGHYMDVYMMIMPATVIDRYGFGIAEFSSILIFLGLFLLLVFYSLSKEELLAKGNPMIKESENFHY